MASPPAPVYAKTNPAGGASLSPRAKRVLITVCAVVVAALIGGGIWSAVSPDRYGSSANGCVNVTVAGSTGAELIHKCGSDARAFCRSAYGGSGQLSLAARPQCEAAGLTRARLGLG